MTSWKHGAPRAAFISGGGSGIGLCLVKSLISEGTNASDMSPPDLAINSAGMMRNGEFTVLPYETFERAV